MSVKSVLFYVNIADIESLTIVLFIEQWTTFEFNIINKDIIPFACLYILLAFHPRKGTTFKFHVKNKPSLYIFVCIIYFVVIMDN